MVTDEFILLVSEEFGFEPTDEQFLAMKTFSEFLACSEPHSVMILRGSAGTGKTSLAAAIVRTMKKIGRKTMLLAPTGRAAKVFSVTSGEPAYTIHRRIYRQKKFEGAGGVFSIDYNKYADTLFLVDESSMIANSGFSGSMFGTGRLLDDLVTFVYTGRNCRMVLIGDSAQLPPVGEERSPALSKTFMEGYGLFVYECMLTEVLRQGQTSGILYNATKIRSLIAHHCVSYKPQIILDGFADIGVVTGEDLIETMSGSYAAVGVDETMVVTRSNKRANIYNFGIRNQVLGREEELSQGDMIMIVKNNYYWPEKLKCKDLEFIANGDRAMVRRVRNVRELYGFRFADVILEFPDYDHVEMNVTVILDSLKTEAPSLTQKQNEQLFLNVFEDYADVRIKQARIKKVREDPYFNALQIKFAYAVTCHKAQGGQWAHIYLDQGYMTEEMMNADYIHWLYTAFTRATEKLFLVNWPPQLLEEKS